MDVEGVHNYNPLDDYVDISNVDTLGDSADDVFIEENCADRNNDMGNGDENDNAVGVNVENANTGDIR